MFLCPCWCAYIVAFCYDEQHDKAARSPVCCFLGRAYAYQFQNTYNGDGLERVHGMLLVRIRYTLLASLREQPITLTSRGVLSIVFTHGTPGFLTSVPKNVEEGTLVLASHQHAPQDEIPSKLAECVLKHQVHCIEEFLDDPHLIWSILLPNRIQNGTGFSPTGSHLVFAVAGIRSVTK